jgi:TonB family protein
MRKDWEGRTIDGFVLERYLGGSVFQTTLESQTAAIKLIPRNPEQELRWAEAAELSHPNLIRIFLSGEDADVSYCVMEFADENLAQVLPERPLSAAETRDMLAPALAALDYLHKKGLVHSNLKPSNIMAAGDRLKISSDRLRRAGDSPDFAAGPYDPPDRATLSPAWDVWSLGIVLIEVLTQRRQGPPSNLPQPFAAIAHRCLQPKAQDRWAVPEIAAYLADPEPETRRHRPFTVPPAVWGFLALAAVMVAGVMWKRSDTSTPAQAPPVVRSAQPVPDAPPLAPPQAEKPARKSKKTMAKTAAPAHEPAAAPNANQPMPNILPEARSGIRGRVRVSVKVDVDPSGAVTNAAVAQHSSSKYFDARSLEAARQWTFAPAAAPQQWVVEFEFLASGTKATQRRVSP